MKWLVIETQYFFDGHGTPDTGSVEKFITEEKVYSLSDPDSYYYSYELQYIKEKDFKDINEMKEALDEAVCKHLHESDGYNCSASKFKAKEITEEEAIIFSKIINDYKHLNIK